MLWRINLALARTYPVIGLCLCAFALKRWSGLNGMPVGILGHIPLIFGAEKEAGLLRSLSGRGHHQVA